MRLCTHPCIAHECTDGSCKLAAGERCEIAVINSGGLQHAHHEPTWQRLGVCRAVCADAPLQVVVRRALTHALSVEAAALAGDTDSGGGKDGAAPAHTLANTVKGAALAGDAVALRVRACSASPRGKESVSGDRSQQPQHMAIRVCTHPCIAQECTDGSCKLAAGEYYGTAVINSGGLQHAHHEPTWQRLGVCRAVCADAMLEVVVRRAPAHALIVEAAALAGDTDAGGGKDGALLALAHALIVEAAVLAGDAVALRVRACSPSPRVARRV